MGSLFQCCSGTKFLCSNLVWWSCKFWSDIIRARKSSFGPYYFLRYPPKYWSPYQPKQSKGFPSLKLCYNCLLNTVLSLIKFDKVPWCLCRGCLLRQGCHSGTWVLKLLSDRHHEPISSVSSSLHCYYLSMLVSSLLCSIPKLLGILSLFPMFAACWSLSL